MIYFLLGTLFCGQDNIADNSGELGLFSTTDSCCRDHDHCKHGIPAGEKKYGLSNTGLFTRLTSHDSKKFISINFCYFLDLIVTVTRNFITA